jgi:hypothetical protein
MSRSLATGKISFHRSKFPSCEAGNILKSPGDLKAAGGVEKDYFSASLSPEERRPGKPDFLRKKL